MEGRSGLVSAENSLLLPWSGTARLPQTKGSWSWLGRSPVFLALGCASSLTPEPGPKVAATGGPASAYGDISLGSPGVHFASKPRPGFALPAEVVRTLLQAKAHPYLL